MLRVINPAHKKLSLFGFLLLRAIFTIQGAHNRFGIMAAGSWSNQQQFALWLWFRQEVFYLAFCF
jgi:hypothetical protein